MDKLRERPVGFALAPAKRLHGFLSNRHRLFQRGAHRLHARGVHALRLRIAHRFGFARAPDCAVLAVRDRPGWQHAVEPRPVRFAQAGSRVVLHVEKRRRRRAPLLVFPARHAVVFVSLRGVVRGAAVVPVVAQLLFLAKRGGVFPGDVARRFVLHRAPGFDHGEAEGIPRAVLTRRHREHVPTRVRGLHLNALVVPPVPAVSRGRAPHQFHTAHGPRHVAVPNLVGDPAQVHGEGDGRDPGAQTREGSHRAVVQLRNA